MDIQRMTFDPDKSRNFAVLQIPTSQIVENSFRELPQYVNYSNNRNRSNAQKVIQLLYVLCIYFRSTMKTNARRCQRT